MQLLIDRAFEARRNRRGVVDGESWRLSFRLEASPAERTIIEDFGLGGEMVYSIGSQGLYWTADQLLSGTQKYPRSLTMALAVELGNAVLAGARNFARAVRMAPELPGSHVIDLGDGAGAAG